MSNSVVMGALVGLAIGVLLLVFDYMMIRQGAAERAKRQHLTVVTLDNTERKRLRSLFSFCLFLPPALALAFWIFD
jgi:hypothetical protein